MSKFINVIKSIALWVWQLPQHLLAILVIAFNYVFNGLKSVDLTYEGKVYKVLVVKSFWNSGVSLGQYIILDDIYVSFKLAEKRKMITIKHEYGHTRQSLILGPLYLLLIGIPSITGNLIDRAMGKRDLVTREKWYYGLPWEKWADKLGNVTKDRESYHIEYSTYGTTNKSSGK